MGVEATLEERQRALSKIAKTFSLADIYAFGSNAKKALSFVKGEVKSIEIPPSSDLDIGVRPKWGTYLRAKQKVELIIALEDFFNVSRVDLINLYEADPYLALDVIRGELLYSNDPDSQAEHELFVLRRAGDLMPYKRERMRMALEGA
ncbi:MAG TPA: nucleotidyltransferase domain-containing protein [Candidatus Hydrothermia bacterium]|nr:nucleotidyltransferase domain-containing protein [Candidatus Hydrothermia bacterium]HPO79638.1 nucleotidyltransferase domain-containing protein [Candidatus Hydrothermia bacterium]